MVQADAQNIYPIRDPWIDERRRKDMKIYAGSVISVLEEALDYLGSIVGALVYFTVREQSRSWNWVSIFFKFDGRQDLFKQHKSLKFYWTLDKFSARWKFPGRSVTRTIPNHLHTPNSNIREIPINKNSP